MPQHEIIADWITFLTETQKRAVSKDTWNMILEFAVYHETDTELSSYDEEAAWPSVIDEFVEYLRAKRG